MLVELTIFTMHSVARWRQWTSKRNRGVLAAQKEGENGEKEPPRKNMSQTAGALVCSPTGDGGREGENGKNLDKSKTEPRSFLLSFPVPYSVLHTQEKRGKGIGRGTHGEREGMREKETSKRRGPLSQQPLLRATTLSERRRPRGKSALPAAQAKLVLKQPQTLEHLRV